MRKGDFVPINLASSLSNGILVGMKVIPVLWLGLAAVALAQRDGRAEYDRRLEDMQRELEYMEWRNSIRERDEARRRAEEAERQQWEDSRRRQEADRPHREALQRSMAQEAARREMEAKYGKTPTISPQTFEILRRTFPAVEQSKTPTRHIIPLDLPQKPAEQSEAYREEVERRVIAEEERLLATPLDSERQRMLTERIAKVEKDFHFLDADLRSKIIRSTRIDVAREQEASNKSKSESLRR